MPTATFFNLPEEKRQKFLECAIEEFAHNDYESASISKIVQNAGIAKGSLYQYFSDKSELYKYLIELASLKKAALMAKVKPPGPNLPFFEWLRRMFQEMARYELLYPDLAKIGYRAVYGKSPLPEDVVQKARQSTVDYFARWIELGKQRGEIRADVDARTAAFLVSAVLTQMGDFLAGRAGVSPEQIAEKGSYPSDAPEVQEAFQQIMSILQSGLVKPS